MRLNPSQVRLKQTLETNTGGYPHPSQIGAKLGGWPHRGLDRGSQGWDQTGAAKGLGPDGGTGVGPDGSKGQMGGRGGPDRRGPRWGQGVGPDGSGGQMGAGVEPNRYRGQMGGRVGPDGSRRQMGDRGWARWE